jgi:hypothetical protein
MQIQDPRLIRSRYRDMVGNVRPYICHGNYQVECGMWPDVVCWYAIFSLRYGSHRKVVFNAPERIGSDMALADLLML